MIDLCPNLTPELILFYAIGIISAMMGIIQMLVTFAGPDVEDVNGGLGLNVGGRVIRLMLPFLLIPSALLANSSNRLSGALDETTDASYQQVSEYDVIFDSASQDEADSIPMGNGTTGINLWVEESGDLLFYVARNDAISEMHRLLKLGRVRVSFSRNPFEKGKAYHQKLNLVDGVCEITAGKDQDAIKLKVWVDSDSQVIYVTGDSQKPRHIKVALENWRTETNVLEAGEIGSTWIYRTGIPGQLTPNSEAADLVLDVSNTIQWKHRNAHTPVPVHIEQMRLQEDKSRILDPIARRTFGGVIWGGSRILLRM